ncbi:phage tail tape measure protein [Staphylococcus rostri]
MANPIGNMVIRVDLDGSGFNKGIAGLNRQMRMVSREMSASLSKFGRYDQSLEKSKVKVEGLTKRQQVQAQKVKELKQQYDQLSKETGENSAKTQAAAAKYNEAYATLNKYERELEEATEEMKKMEQQQRILSTSVGKVGQKFSEWGPKLKEVGQQMQSIGRSMTTYVTTPIVAGFGAAVKASINYESAFAGVRKTVNASEKDYKKLSDGILNMSKNLPVAATDIANVAEMAGQLGIKKNNILEFSKTIIDLGESTNLTREQAATEFAKFANIVKMPQESFSKLGSSIVALGNNMATTESDIMSMSMRIAAQGKLVGMTESDITALAATMSSLGIEAEAGGTAMTTVLKKIEGAVTSGGESLEAFASASGMSASEFKQQWESDPVQALNSFITGLGKSGAEGKNLTNILSDLGIKGVREADTVLRMANNHELLGKAVGISGKAWKEDKALSKEANERYKTMSSKLKILKNNFVAFGVSLGDAIAPYVIKVSEKLTGLLKKMSNMSDGMKITIAVVGGLAAAIGPLLMGLGVMVSTIGSAMTVLGPFLKSIRTLSFLSKTASGVTKLWGGAQKAWNGVIKVSKAIADLYRLSVTKLTSAQTLSTLKTKLAATATKVWTATTKAAALASKGLGLALRFMTGPVGIVITAVGLLVAGVIHLWKTNEGFRNGVIRIWDSIKNGISTVVEFIRNFAVNSWNNLKAAGITIFTLLKTGLTGIFNALKTYFITILIVYKTIFTTTFNAIKAIVTSIIGFIVNFIKNAWNGVKNETIFIFNSLKFFLTKVWNAIKSSIITIVSILYNSVKNIWSSLSRFTRNIFSNLRSFLVNLWSRLKDSVIHAARLLWDGVRKTWNFLLSGTRSIFNRVKTSMVNIWNGIKRSVTGIASGLWNSVRNTFNNMSNGLKNIINRIKGHINGMVNSVKSGLNKLIDGVNWVAGKIGMTKIPRLHTGTTHTTTHNLVTNGKINRDTFATVGDKGRGNGPGGFRHEMIRYPNGKMALTPNRDTTAFLPKGSAVFNGAQTHAMLSQVGKLPKFARGTGFDILGGGKKPKKHKHGDHVAGDVQTKKGSKPLMGTVLESGKAAINSVAKTFAKGKQWLADNIGDVLDWIEKPKELFNKVMDGFGFSLDSLGISKSAAIPYNLMKGAVKRLKDGASKLIQTWLEDAGGGDGGYIDLSKGISFGFHSTAASARAAGYPFVRPHYGLDINYKHDKVFSTLNGTANASYGYNGGFGNMVQITSGIITAIYGHLHKLAFTGSKKVHPGSYLGISGGDPREDGAGAGSSTGLHLHYEMRWNGVAKDPTNWLKKNNGKGKSGSYPSGSGAGYASNVIKRAQAILGGRYKGSYVHDQMMRVAWRESNYQSNAVNNWDINAQRGDPSRGLFQIIGSTFRANAKAGYTNFNNPVHQAISAMRYIVARYGWGGFKRAGDYAYATGGLVYDGLYRLGEQGYPEWVIPTDPARASDAAKLIALASKDISKNKRPKNLSTSGINGADSNSSLESKLDVMIGLLIKLVGSNEDIASKDYKPIIDSFGLADFINTTVEKRERQEARKNRFKPGGALI